MLAAHHTPAFLCEGFTLLGDGEVVPVNLADKHPPKPLGGPPRYCVGLPIVRERGYYIDVRHPLKHLGVLLGHNQAWFGIAVCNPLCHRQDVDDVPSRPQLHDGHRFPKPSLCPVCNELFALIKEISIV